MTNLSTILHERISLARTGLDRLIIAETGAIQILEAVKNVFTGGGTLYTCGNGGSAAQALHFSEELLGRFNATRPPLASICLNADPTALTCIANDFGFETIFARQVEALIRPADALAVLSTSGNSPNIVAALVEAKRRGATTIGFLGGDGGDALAHCDVSVVIDAPDTASIQEAHQTLLHACCATVEPQDCGSDCSCTSKDSL
jgi:D-sedoheptulose 7-phosphate isomerase